MKALIVTLFVFLASTAWAKKEIDPNQMTEQQKVQLIQVLNQLEPEMLELLLTDEALEWYISQFTRGGENEEIPVSTGQVEGIGGFDDPNAPQFL